VNGRRGAACLAIVALLTLLPARAGAQASSDQLVQQLQSRGIRDPRLLDAFRRVRREAFVPHAGRRAYDDAPLDIGHGQTTSQPYVIALMTDQLGLKGDERVLEIGTGSGYGTAILASVARDIYTVEIIPELATAARLRLTREGYRNVHVKQGDGTQGWREYGPYDAIIVDAAAPTVPRPLIDQLKEGGVLVMPLGERDGRQILVRGVKRGTKLRTREVGEVRFVPLLRAGPRPSAPRVEPRRPSPPPELEEDDEPAPPSRRDDVRRPPPPPVDEDEDDAPPPRGHAAPALRPPADDDGPRPRVDERVAPRRPAPDLNEEELPEGDPSPESDTRPLPDARSRAARAPAAPDSGRRVAAGAARSGAADSRSAGPRSAA
jgi:protein-L-isoaspartate(D-aspartate) O-methyltransferase